MLNWIVSSLFIILFFSVLTFAIIITRKNYDLSQKILQSEVDKVLMAKYLISHKEDPEHIDKSKDDFIKFLSDSRDWAFDYIQTVQDTLGEFVSNLDTDIEYFDEYGDFMSIKPNYELLKKVSENYKKLKPLLPSDEEK